MIDWEEFYEEDLEILRASDYYFQVGFGIACGTKNDAYFSITPKGYFDATGAHSDLSGVADHVVPKGFYELTESCYEYNGNEQIGRNLLLRAGFIEKKMF